MSETCKIPLGGNGFISNQSSPTIHEVIHKEGLENWMDPNTIISIFFHVPQPIKFSLALRLRVPSKNGVSRIRVTCQTQSYELDVEGKEFHPVPVGPIIVSDPGYVSICLQGLSRSKSFFADVSDLILSHLPIGSSQKFRCVLEPNDFYFGRRGPSVHLRFQTPKTLQSNFEYFYNEVSVPKGQDVIGAYFMAVGFSGGYFGIQVLGPDPIKDRRILFSIWSAYKTDDPCQIPDDYRVKVLKVGSGVTVQDFGDEGSGKQSFISYPWVPERTYKFLVFGSPMDSDNTKFSAWFCDPSSGATWKLISSFQRPKTSEYLSSFYSFSENFVPGMGHVERRAHFGNQWVRDTTEAWTELLSARFTGDETSRKTRLDFAGGVHVDSKNGSQQFFLRNCGFFSDRVETNQWFTRKPTSVPPKVKPEELE